MADKPVTNIDPLKRRNKMPELRVDLVLQEIERLGREVYWEKSFQCPCIDPKTHAPKPNCKVCHGQGIVFKGPYQLRMLMQSDDKGVYNGHYGSQEIRSAIATPQLTENGIENGISARDRITIKDMQITQTYTFNATPLRMSKGMFIPYSVDSIDEAYTLDSEGLLLTIDPKTLVYNKDSSTLSITDNTLAGKNISLVLSVDARYYVADITKETRYAYVSTAKGKLAMVGNYNTNLKYQDLYGADFSGLKGNAATPVRLPKKLIIRREDLFVPDSNIVINDNDNLSQITDPKVSADMSDFFGDTNG